MEHVVTKQNQLVGLVLLLTLDYFLLKFFFTQTLEPIDFAVFVIGIFACLLAMKFLGDSQINREDVESPVTKILSAVNLFLVIVFFAGFVANVWRVAGDGVWVLFAQFGIVIIIGAVYLKMFGDKAEKFKKAAEALGLKTSKTELETQAVYAKNAIGRICESDEMARGIIEGKFVRVGLCKKRSKHGPMFSLIIAISPAELFDKYQKALAKIEELKNIEKTSKRKNSREKDTTIRDWWANFEDAKYLDLDDETFEEKFGVVSGIISGKNLVEFEEELKDDLKKQLTSAVQKSKQFFK